MSDDFCSPHIFGVEVELDGSAAVMRLSGELDISCEDPFVAAVDDTLERGASELTVDLTDVSFIDSSGLRFLIELWARARKQQFELTLVQGSGMVRRTLEIAGLDRVLPIVDRGSSRTEPV
jgi:anti-sigma B factor antagonist